MSLDRLQTGHAYRSLFDFGDIDQRQCVGKLDRIADAGDWLASRGLVDVFGHRWSDGGHEARAQPAEPRRILEGELPGVQHANAGQLQQHRYTAMMAMHQFATL